MDKKEIKEKSEVELARQVESEREKVRDLRFKDAAGQLKKVRDLRAAKKNVARLLTEKRVRSAK
jgi:large subunit ribosomal protein L29